MSALDPAVAPNTGPPHGFTAEEWATAVDSLIERSTASSRVPLTVEEETTLAVIARLLEEAAGAR
jgi:hypothetical protein